MDEERQFKRKVKRLDTYGEPTREEKRAAFREKAREKYQGLKERGSKVYGKMKSGVAATRERAEKVRSKSQKLSKRFGDFRDAASASMSNVFGDEEPIRRTTRKTKTKRRKQPKVVYVQVVKKSKSKKTRGKTRSKKKGRKQKRQRDMFDLDFGF